MTPPIVAFFNAKTDVGKTTLAYHVGWMLRQPARNSYLSTSARTWVRPTGQ